MWKAENNSTLFLDQQVPYLFIFGAIFFPLGSVSLKYLFFNYIDKHIFPG